MSIVIGEFEVVGEPENRPPSSESGEQVPAASAPGVTPETIAGMERYLTERALRVWAG